MLIQTLCAQCAMRAIVEGKEPPVFNEEPAEHLARCHPDPEATQAERADLERRLSQMLLERGLDGRRN